MSAALLVVAAVVLTSVAGTRPSFDAYGWLTWGHMTLHGGLNTNAAPSFKPLPYVLTLVDALFGGAQMRLWMIESAAVSLAGLVFAGRLAYRLTGAGRNSAPMATRAAGGLAAALAVVGVLCLHDEFPFGYLHYMLSAQSDPMVVALLLAAIDRQVGGRSDWAFALLGLAALGRPEVWPFLGLHGAWLWRRRPGCRWAVLAVPATVALLWFGIPALTSHSWLIAADNAHASGFGPRHDKALGVLSRFVIQAPWPLQVAAVVAVVDGARRRDRLVGALAACVVVWMAIEVAFGLHGWPALGRYMFEASALVVVLGAGLVGRVLALGVPVPASPWVRLGPIVAGGAVGFTIALAVTQGDAARSDLLRQRARTASIDRLTALVGRLGGPKGVRACGEPISDGLATQTVLAFTVARNVNAVGYRFPQPGHPRDPAVVFRPLAGGRWSARALRQGVGSGCRVR